MSIKIDTVLQAMEKVSYREDVSVQSTPPSQVTPDNPYRYILDDIRNCLIHYDGEKKERIIYSIQLLKSKASEETSLLLDSAEELVSNYDTDDKKISSELNSVLDRVLEVVNNYNEKGVVFCSPEKKAPPPSDVSKKASPNCRKKLFE